MLSALLLWGRLTRRRAYLKAPEPPDESAPLKAGWFQPLIQAALQGAQARGTGTNDGYFLGSHVLQDCGGGRDAGASCPWAKHTWGCVEPGESQRGCTVSLGCGWLSQCFPSLTEISWAVARCVSSSYDLQVRPAAMPHLLPAPPPAKGSLGSVSA